MGINIITAHQIWELWDSGELEGCNSVVELAPHFLGTVTGRTQCYLEWAKQTFGDCEKTREFERTTFNADGSLKSPKLAQIEFYKLFGLDEYISIDYLDENATYKKDLNDPLDLDRTFDVVAEYGTAEHIFNIGQFFENAYNLLRPGGLSMHLLPVMGQIYHGFYNIHTVLYRSLAAAGLYEIVKFDYLPALPTPMYRTEKTLKMPRIFDIREQEAPQTTFRFYMNDIWQAMTGGYRPSAMVFVVLRKINDQPFHFPQQCNKYWAPKTEASLQTIDTN